jgi:hypothetical protein
MNGSFRPVNSSPAIIQLIVQHLDALGFFVCSCRLRRLGSVKSAENGVKGAITSRQIFTANGLPNFLHCEPFTPTNQQLIENSAPMSRHPF